MTDIILTNAQVILENEIITGTICFNQNMIVSVDQGRSQLPGAIDVEGDYIAPGLIEMHTDNMESILCRVPVSIGPIAWPLPLPMTRKWPHQA